jgi:uncharacterized protein (TIGR02118 family)
VKEVDSVLKAVAMLKRKPGLTSEEFRSHYEEVHAPLCLRLFPTIRRYMRNYVTQTIASGTGNSGFDCITEQWFDDMEGLQEMLSLSAGDAGRRVRDDEKTFLDRTKTVYMVVEEVASL